SRASGQLPATSRPALVEVRRPTRIASGSAKASWRDVPSRSTAQAASWSPCRSPIWRSVRAASSAPSVLHSSSCSGPRERGSSSTRASRSSTAAGSKSRAGLPARSEGRCMGAALVLDEGEDVELLIFLEEALSLALDQAQEGLADGRVELRALETVHLADPRLERRRPPVGAVARHRLDGVGDQN